MSGAPLTLPDSHKYRTCLASAPLEKVKELHRQQHRLSVYSATCPGSSWTCHTPAGGNQCLTSGTNQGEDSTSPLANKHCPHDVVAHPFVSQPLHSHATNWTDLIFKTLLRLKLSSDAADSSEPRATQSVRSRRPSPAHSQADTCYMNMSRRSGARAAHFLHTKHLVKATAGKKSFNVPTPTKELAVDWPARLQPVVCFGLHVLRFCCALHQLPHPPLLHCSSERMCVRYGTVPVAVSEPEHGSTGRRSHLFSAASGSASGATLKRAPLSPARDRCTAESNALKWLGVGS